MIVQNHLLRKLQIALIFKRLYSRMANEMKYDNKDHYVYLSKALYQVIEIQEVREQLARMVPIGLS